MTTARMAAAAIARRVFLKQSLAAVFLPGIAASARGQFNPAPSTPTSPAPGFADHGPIKPPLPLPELTVLRDDGEPALLQSLAANHVTALQLIFTSCTTTCPMQGATFERVQSIIPDMRQHGIQLISLSVDPKNDTPHALAEWLATFHAGPAWIGASPAPEKLAEIKTFFGAGRDSLDPHSTRTSILDRSGRLIFRTYELPPPELIASILRRV